MAAAAAKQSAFYSEAADYAANFGSVVTGTQIGVVSDKSPLECVRACNGNPACIAFSTTVSTAVVPGLAVTYYKQALDRLPTSWASMSPVKDMLVSTVNFPSGQIQGQSGMTTNFAASFKGVVVVPTAGQWTFFCSSDDGSKLYVHAR